MGICETYKQNKVFEKEIKRLDNDKQFKKVKGNQNQIYAHPTVFNNTNGNISMTTDITNNKKPELIKYERSYDAQGKSLDYSHQNNINSFSSKATDEEFIINGEINSKAKYNEGDFNNSSFRQLIINNGGTLVKNSDINSNYTNSMRTNSFLKFGSENISEIPSTANSLRSNVDSFSSSYLLFDSKNNKKEVNINKKPEDIIKGKNNQNGENMNMNLNQNIKNINNTNLIGNNKINPSLHDSQSKLDSFINIPKTDHPLPDINDFSGIYNGK